MSARTLTVSIALLSLTATVVQAAPVPVPRIELAVRQPAAPVLAGGLEMKVLHSLDAKPDFAAMASGPRQAGIAVLRVEALVTPQDGDAASHGRWVEGLVLAAEVVRQVDGKSWTHPVMEFVPCQIGPHYEATFILDRPGLYSVTVTPGLAADRQMVAGREPTLTPIVDREATEQALASGPSAARGAPEGLSTAFTVDFTMPDEALRSARARWEADIAGFSTRRDAASGASRTPAKRTVDISSPESVSAGTSVTQGTGGAPLATAAEPVADDMTLLLNWDTRPNYSAGCGYEDATGKFAVVGATDGTVIVEVTDPQNPVEWGFIPGCVSTWRECKTWGTHAYMTTEASGCGMQIIDLSNPRTPFLATTHTATFNTSHTVFINHDGFMYVNGSRFNGGPTSMLIYNLNVDAVNLSPINAFTTRYVHDSHEAYDALSGTYKLYLSEIYNGLQEIYDDSDKISLLRLGSWASPQNFTHNSAVDPFHRTVMTTDEIDPASGNGGKGAVYDITDPSHPVFLSEYRGGAADTVIHNAHYDDGDPTLVWASHYTQGARLIDVTQPSFPLEIGHYDTYVTVPPGSGFNGCWEAWPYDRDGWAYLIDRQTGLYVVRHDPTTGRLSGIVRNEATGAPIAGALVLEMESGLSVRTNSLGVYAMRLSPGPARLRVSGYGGYTKEADAMVLTGVHSELDVELSALPSRELSGFVLRTGDLAPIADVLVTNPASGQSTTTLGDGSFSFPDVPLGARRLNASKLGFSPSQTLVLLGPEGVLAAADSGGAAAGPVDPGVTILLEPARWFDDAEIDRGWVLGSGDTAGVTGRWVRSDPNGTDESLAQSEDDHTPTGTTCFVTGNGVPGGAAEANDVDAGLTTAMSPTFDASGLGAAAIDYWRWFSNMRGSNTGSFGTLTIEVSTNNGSSWSTLESVTKEANRWTNKIMNLATMTSLMKIRARATATAGTPSTTGIVEAGLDDIQLIRACSPVFNTQAANTDGDALVNGCDPCPSDPLNDIDGDGVCGNTDRSPFVNDPGQADVDADSVGDVVDNCPAVANADQADNDGDSIGNACDLDDDQDGTPDTADDDDDGDGVLDATDNCPGMRNPNQADHGGSQPGDACDASDGLVTGERFIMKATLVWDRETTASAYNVYRGEVGAAILVPSATCLARALVTTFVSDPEIPNPGDASFYLAAAIVGGFEQGLGYTSAGAVRIVNVHCP